MLSLSRPVLLVVASCFVLFRTSSAIRCSYNTSSVSTGPTGYNVGGGSASTTDCGKNSKYCITGNATSYVTTDDQTNGKGTTKVTASFHACDTKMDLVGADVLQGYKDINCDKEGVVPFSFKNWDAVQGESISGYIDCSTTSDPSSGFRPVASLFSTGLMLAVLGIITA